MEETRPCALCGKQLECAVNDWSSNQPYGGGEVKFHFHYGSCKFDLNMYGTEFVGLICDECAEKCVERMTRTTEDTFTGSPKVPLEIETDAPDDQEGRQ